MGRFRRKSVSRDPCDDVIMTSSNGVCHWPHVIIHLEFGNDRMRNDQVIRLSDQKWAVFAGNQSAVTRVMTSSNGVCHWPHVIIHMKFGDDQMRNDQVITLSDQKWATFAGNQWAVTHVMTSSWRHQMGFVTDPVSSFILSLVTIGWETIELSC